MSVDELIRDSLTDLAATRAATDRDRSRVDLRADQLRHGRTRKRVALVSAVGVIVVALFVLTHRGPSVTTTEIGPADSSGLTAPSTTASTPTGEGAWLLPPKTTGNVTLVAVEMSGRSYGSGGGISSWPLATFGPIAMMATGVLPSHEVSYTYAAAGESPQSGSDPSIRVRTVTGVNMAPVKGGRTRLTNGFEVLDAGDVCAPDGRKQLIGWIVVTFTPCRHVLLAWHGDLGVAVDATTGTDLDDLVAGFRLVSLDQLESGLAGIPSVDQFAAFMAMPEPTTPPTTLKDSDLCRAWADVLAHAHGPLDDPSLVAAMDRMADLSPPELAADLHLLAQQWSQAQPSTESGATMARVTNAAAEQCGGMRMALPSTPGG